jgi:hypothetical protein
MTSTERDELQAAVDGFVDSWFPYTMADLLDKTTCSETAALCAVLEAAGHGDLVADVIEMHAHGDDDCEDDHHARWLELTGKSPCGCEPCELGQHRPDDDPEPGNRCKDCGNAITWRGPGPNDWDLAGEADA